jgi:hypothetical protein
MGSQKVPGMEGGIALEWQDIRQRLPNHLQSRNLAPARTCACIRTYTHYIHTYITYIHTHTRAHLLHRYIYTFIHTLYTHTSARTLTPSILPLLEAPAESFGVRPSHSIWCPPWFWNVSPWSPFSEWACGWRTEDCVVNFIACVRLNRHLTYAIALPRQPVMVVQGSALHDSSMTQQLACYTVYKFWCQHKENYVLD